MKKTYPIKDYRILREFPRITPTAQDFTVRREENGWGGFHYVTVSCPVDFHGPTLTLTRGFSARRRTLKDARQLRSPERRLLKHGKGGWREEPNWWRLQIGRDADLKRAVFALREWLGLELVDARRLARTLQAKPGQSLRVPLTFAETKAADTCDPLASTYDPRIRALLATVGIVAWKEST